MNHLIFYNGKDPCFSLWKQEFDGCHAISEAMKMAGWTVVWMIYMNGECWPMYGYKKAFEEYKNLDK